MEKLLVVISGLFASLAVLIASVLVFQLMYPASDLHTFLKVLKSPLEVTKLQSKDQLPSSTPIHSKNLTTRKPAVKLDPNNPNEWYRTVGTDGSTSAYIPESEQMSTPEELFTAMNNYRASHGLSILQSNGKLCEVASKRAVEAASHFSHDGFEKYVQDQNEFSLMAEVLFTGGKLSGVHLVEYGWDRSLTGHKETIRDPRWTHGCGGISGTTAAFIFGQHF